VELRSQAEKIIAALAALACLVFLLGLRDIPLRGPEVGEPVTLGDQRPTPGRLLVTAFEACADAPCAALAGAKVRAFFATRSGYALVARGVTDSRGRVVLERLPEGALVVVVESAGRERVSRRITQGPGERSLELALAEAQSLRVTVLDERGAPIRDATVLTTTRDLLPFGALTDPQGSAAFARLGAGPYRVKASARGYESATRDDVTGPLTLTLRDLGDLRVSVRTGDGKAAMGASVLIVGSRLWPARSMTTDASGAVVISGLLAGSYDVKATHGDWVSETSVGVSVARGEQSNLALVLVPGRRVQVWVTDGSAERADPVPNADVVLAEGGLSSFPLRGRTGLDGKVELGPIAPGLATVSARAADFVPRGSAYVPDPLEGPVRIALLKAGRIEVKVTDVRGYPVDGATLEVLGSDLEGMPIAETPELVGFRARHFAWALAGPAPLIPAGELGVMPGPIPPIPGETASVDPAAFGVPFASFTDAEATFVIAPWITRGNGEVTLEPVTPGRVRVLARHPAFVEGLSESVLVEPNGRARVSILLARGGALLGRVFDERGAPVAGARVDATAVAGRFERSTLSAGDGRFELAAVPGEVVLAVARPEDRSRVVVRARVNVPEGKRTEVKLVLPAPRAAATVTVVDGARRPLLGAQVTVTSLAPEFPLRQTLFADEAGVVRFEDVVGLATEVAAEAPGLLRLVRSLSAFPKELRLELQAGVLVVGRVTTLRGRRPLAGASVTLATEGTRHAAMTDEDGAFRMDGLPPGPGRVQISHAALAPLEATVHIERPTRSDRAFELPAFDLGEGGSIEGVVVDARGKPVLGARVGLGFVPAYLPVGALPPDVTVTDLEGRFTLASVPAGDVIVGALAPESGRGQVSVQVVAGRVARNVRVPLTTAVSDDDGGAPGNVAITLGAAEAAEDIVVVHVAAGSEAERAGIAVGDWLVSVDGVEPANLGDARRRLGGQEGSDVVITLERDERPLSVRVRRERVRR
jgi:hypothetical protein